MLAIPFYRTMIARREETHADSETRQNQEVNLPHQLLLLNRIQLSLWEPPHRFAVKLWIRILLLESHRRPEVLSLPLLHISSDEGGRTGSDVRGGFARGVLLERGGAVLLLLGGSGGGQDRDDVCRRVGLCHGRHDEMLLVVSQG